MLDNYHYNKILINIKMFYKTLDDNKIQNYYDKINNFMYIIFLIRYFNIIVVKFL